MGGVEGRGRVSNGGAPTYINLKVKYAPNGHEVYFNVTRNSELERVMSVSCERLSLERNDIRFVYKGHYVSAKATPDQLGMEDGDVIDAISVRPLNQPTTDPINLCVKFYGQGLGVHTLFVKMKKSTKLKKLMTMYCDRYSVPAECLSFLFEGRRLHDEHTADELEMEDGDEIYVMRHIHLHVKSAAAGSSSDMIKWVTVLRSTYCRECS